MNIAQVDFEKIISDEYEGGECRVISLGNATYSDFDAYSKALTEQGFERRGLHFFGENSFCCHENAQDSIFTSFYPSLSLMRIVSEKNTNYINFRYENGKRNTDALITQIDLEDFGMSYVIRMTDGKFIVFDGGWEFEPDADKLMQCLTQQSGGEKPCIAAWLFTHPDIDHYRCFIEFTRKYRDSVTVESFIYNFPDITPDVLKSYPKFSVYGESENLPRFENAVKSYNAQVIRAHTGQIFTLCNTTLEILSSPDDTLKVPVTDCNVLSLIVKMNIAGQTVLWSGDGYYEESKLAERYGEYLKADILQVPHHGFCGGSAKGYSFIDPQVCLIPVFKDDCFSVINIYMENNDFLMKRMNVQEVITGSEGTKTLKLPYKAPSGARELLVRNMEEGQKSRGARSWIFPENIKTAGAKCEFTIVNTTANPAQIFISLYFEDSKNTVKDIKVVAGAMSVRKIDLFSADDVDGDALYFNRQSLDKIGIVENALFAAHFASNVPVVISKSGENTVYCR